MKYFLNRIKEPSTLAGLGILATLFGVSPEQVTAASTVITALLGAAAVFVPEKM